MQSNGDAASPDEVVSVVSVARDSTSFDKNGSESVENAYARGTRLCNNGYFELLRATLLRLLLATTLQLRHVARDFLAVCSSAGTGWAS